MGSISDYLHKNTKQTQKKVGKVMKEFSSGELKSSSGDKVTDPAQAAAIGYSEADRMKKNGRR